MGKDHTLEFVFMTRWRVKASRTHQNEFYSEIMVVHCESLVFGLSYARVRLCCVCVRQGWRIEHHVKVEKAIVHNLLDPVVRRPICANPRLNFNPGFFIPLFKSLFFLYPF